MNSTSVTVIGLGPMGQAMVNTYLDSGYDVTVWNRTAARADALVARGAKRAASVEAALTANELVVLSLTDYAAMYAILEQAPSAALAGRTIVNLTSDTPDLARSAAAWTAERGAVHITGGVQVPPPGIGKPGSSTFYSGPEDAIEAHRPVLEVLTEIDYLGEDPSLAALYYQLTMDMFWTGMLSYLHATAVAEANGISAEQFLARAASAMDFRYFLEFYAPRIDAGNHGGDVDRLAMGVASMEHVVHTAEESGVDTALPAAVLAHFHRGAAAGHSEDSFTSLVKVLQS